MAVQSPAFALQNGLHTAALFRQAGYSPWRGGGIPTPGEFAVAAQSTPNMSVQVAGGRAWIPGSQVSNVSGQSFSTQAAYFGLNDAPVTLTIATADPTNPRIDLVYVAVQDAFYSGTNNLLVLGVVTGTPAGSPVAPSAPSNAIALAQVRVNANATSITNSVITVTPAATLLAVTRGGVGVVTNESDLTGLTVASGAVYYVTSTKALAVYDSVKGWLFYDTVSQTYTPTLGGGVVLGSGGFNQAWYTRQGKRVRLRIETKFGTSGYNFGTGTWTWSLPAGMSATVGQDVIMPTYVWATSTYITAGAYAFPTTTTALAVNTPTGVQTVAPLQSGTPTSVAGETVIISGFFDNQS